MVTEFKLAAYRKKREKKKLPIQQQPTAAAEKRQLNEFIHTNTAFVSVNAQIQCEWQ